MTEQPQAHKARATSSRETSVGRWTEWLRAEMDQHHLDDPVELLPQALARVEQRAIAEARAAATAVVMHEIRRMFKKALA